MSRYRGNGDACPHCGTLYGRFRTGFTYDAIHDLLKDYSPDAADWRYKRRGTVLGKWHQLKKELWAQHKNEGCGMEPRNVAALEAAE